MKKDRNHEGYHDPTASKAIERVDQKEKPGKKRSDHLTYRLDEVPGLKKLLK